MRLLIFKYMALTIGLFVLPGYAVAQQSCVTGECHSNFQSGKNVHPLDVKCGVCHLDTQKEHVGGGSPPTLSKNMCTDCHEDVLDYRYIHAPVEKGECYLCHDPHGEIRNMLLGKVYSVKKFINYSKDEYRLCFSCHKRELLMFPDTSYATGFRDGVRNLHYLHVNKSKRGRNCKLCHSIHGADQPKMMADTIKFGNWQMPLNFQKSETGGQCSPGCHRPQRYDRKNPQQTPAKKIEEKIIELHKEMK